LNFNQLFNESARQPVIVNDISEETAGDKERFNMAIYTKHASDLLSNMPSCNCGTLIGEYNVGNLCNNCNTPVEHPSDQKLEPILWIRSPNGVAPLLNPIIWTMLSKKFTSSGFNIIQWYCDTGYSPPVKIPAVLESVINLGFNRGYNNFVNNFYPIIEGLFSLKQFKLKKNEENILLLLLKQSRDCIFSNHLPIPNKALLVIEESNFGIYTDATVEGAVDAIRTLVGIDSPLSTFNVRTKENRAAKTIYQLAEFYDSLYSQNLASKEGLFRKHIFGTRCHWSFRAVISSLTDQHAYDELHIPWGIGISVFRLHLINKLLRRSFTPNQAIALLNEHAAKYHPLLDELFKLLIAEAPGGSISCVLQRNPSLERASAQAMRITKIKTEVNIPTISLSILSVVGFNAKIGHSISNSRNESHLNEETLGRDNLVLNSNYVY
jgi:hypothetical protein